MSEIIYVGFCGFAGSGKDTAADLILKQLKEANIPCFKDSYANKLKDIISILMSWDRDMLQGITPESRKWREQPDKYWSTVLGYDISPRQTMQRIGTDLFRKHFSDEIWIASLFAKYRLKEKCVVLISDCRFPNEIKAIEQRNGIILQILTDKDPTDYSKLHESEYSWKNNIQNPISVHNNKKSLKEYEQSLQPTIDLIKKRYYDNMQHKK